MTKHLGPSTKKTDLEPREGDGPPRNYKVGPGNPPLEHRFRKGHSGNHKGRPRKSNMASLFEAMSTALNQKVLIKGKSGTEEIAAGDALMRKMVRDGVTE